MSEHNAHILLIDDDSIVHDAVKMILEPQGYRVSCVLTGEQAIQALERETPDLLLLDIMLATPSEGFHLAYEIRKRDKTRHVPIIVLSAVGKTTGVNYAKEVGSDYLPVEEFLEKPFDAATLRNAVERALTSHGATP